MSTLGPHDPDQEYVDRLRAADPAASSEPDMAALRAAIAQRGVGHDGADPAVPDQLAARRSRRWLPVAAAAAAALVVGSGGGFALGASGGAGSADSGSLNVSMASDGGAGAPEADSAAGGAPQQGSAPVPATGEGRLAERGGADMAWGYYGRTVFTASGLSDQATTAHSWALDAASVDAAALERLAAAIGLEGTVEQTDGALLIGPSDGSGPNLSLYRSGSGDVGYYNPDADPWSCTDVGKAEAGGDTTLAPEGGCTQRDLGPAPTVEQAEAELTTILAAAGIDAADLEFGDTSSQDGWTYATAYRLVDGARSGLVWSASWTGGGLQSLYGTLAPLVDLGSYPVISPAEAVKRLGDPRFGSNGGPIAYAQDAVGDATGLPAPDVVMPSPDPAQVPTTPEPGSAISWPVQQVTIDAAELELSTYTEASGAVVVAPTYRLTGTDGTYWTVIAVADSALDF